MLFGWFSNPCKNGHVFMWTGNTIDDYCEPPVGTPCCCGQTQYKKSDKPYVKTLLSSDSCDGQGLGYCSCPPDMDEDT